MPEEVQGTVRAVVIFSKANHDFKVEDAHGKTIVDWLPLPDNLKWVSN